MTSLIGRKSLSEIRRELTSFVTSRRWELPNQRFGNSTTSIPEESLDTALSELGLSTRSLNCLKRAGVNTIGALVAKNDNDLLRIRDLGRTSLSEIKQELTAFVTSRKWEAQNRWLGDSSASVPKESRETVLSELSLSPRSLNCLNRAGVTTIGELLVQDEPKLLKVKGLGRICLREVKAKLRHYLEFRAGLVAEKTPPRETSHAQEKARSNALHVKQLYEELGTYDAVGKRLGVSRERVRQILERGRRRGWYAFKPLGRMRTAAKLSTFTVDQMRQLMLLSGSLSSVAKSLGCNPGLLKKWCDARGLDFEVIRQQARERKTLEEYKAIVAELGYHPSTTVLNKKKKWRALAARIQRIWGSTAVFRRAFGIEPTFVTQRPWLYRGRQAQG